VDKVIRVGGVSRIGEIERSAVTVWVSGPLAWDLLPLCTTDAAELRTPHAQPASLLGVIAAGNGACTTTNSGARRLSAASSFSEDRCVGEMVPVTRKTPEIMMISGTSLRPVGRPPSHGVRNLPNRLPQGSQQPHTGGVQK
jgi:hypothetical protein